MMRVPRTMGRPETLPGICSISSQAVQSMSACVSNFAMFVPSFHRSFFPHFGAASGLLGRLGRVSKLDARIRRELAILVVIHVVLDLHLTLPRTQLEGQWKQIIRLANTGVLVVQHQADVLNRKRRRDAIGVQRDAVNEMLAVVDEDQS